MFSLIEPLKHKLDVSNVLQFIMFDLQESLCDVYYFDNYLYGKLDNNSMLHRTRRG